MEKSPGLTDKVDINSLTTAFYTKQEDDLNQDITTQEKALRKALGISENEKNLKIIPIGGLDEVGVNCTVFEYGDDIIIVDIGTDFPDSETAGVDLILPDLSYVLSKKTNVRGVVITHGHLDHINGIPYLYNDIKDFDFFASKLSCKLISEIVKDKTGNGNGLKLHIVSSGQKIRLGVFEIEFVHVNHSIPESMALIISTPEGKIFHSGDFKIDYTPVNEQPIDLGRIALAGMEGIKVAMIDSTGAMIPGHAISEKEVGDVLYNLFQKSEGRIIVASFASSVGRIQQVIDASYKLGKRVVIDGRSMVNYTDITRDLDFLKIPKDALITPQIANKLPDDKVVIMCTGSQGQEMSSLSRMAKEEHKNFKIKEGDTVIISASPIPGNELAIVSMMDDLFRKGANVISNATLDVHTSGHGRQEDIKTLLTLLKPEYYIPIHGNRTLREWNKKIAIDVGIPKEKIFVLENGDVFRILGGRAKKEDSRIKVETMVVDGTDVGEMSDVVAKERNVLGKDGFMIIILIIDSSTKSLIDNPDIISRGFVYLRDKEDLIQKTRNKVKSVFDSHAILENKDWETGLKKRIRDEIGRFLTKESGKSPLIVPVVKVVKR